MRRVPTRSALAAALAAATLALPSRTALADPPAAAPAPAATPEPAAKQGTKPDERRDPYSPYERASIDTALKKLGREIEPHPEGKTLEGIDVVTLDVFEKRDPLPGWLMPIANWFHVTSKHYVIEREALVSVGQRWDQSLVDETARNLRGLAQLSVVLCVPVRGADADHVRLLIVTKDVWSLRLNSNYLVADGRLQYLLLQPSEENLAGTHQQILATFVLDPATITLGAQYVLPRIAGSRVSANASANAILNRATGHLEGTYGSWSYGQPLYSTRAEWAWTGGMNWDHEITRRFVGGQFTDFNPSTDRCTVAKGPGDGPAACRYTTDNVGGSYGVTRSWGSLHKHDLTIGVSASRHLYTPFDLSSFSPADQAAFIGHLMPVSDTVIGPYITFHDYSSVFLDLLDVETLALTENFRKGHEITLRVSPVTRALRSTRNFIDLTAEAAYSVPIGDGVVKGTLQGHLEVSTDSAPPPAQGRIPDASIDAALRIVTPRFKIGRLVADVHVLDRAKNYLNSLTSLGGDGRLRGYPAAAFIGSDLLAANLEYRSRAFELFSVELAGAAFFDTGDAFDAFSKMFLKHSVGFGARLGFPQLERTVMRIDWGFPLTRGPGLPTSAWPGDVTITFGQAFGYPTLN